MKIIQHYAQGGKHKLNSQPCEDRTFSFSDNGVHAIALADGAGSKKYTHSAQGAECITKVITEFFCNNFDKLYNNDNKEELSAVFVAVCQRALKMYAEKLGIEEIARFAATLLAVAVKDSRVMAFHIGDGVIGKLTENGTEVLSAPENGEFANLTYFITSPMAKDHVRIYKGSNEGVYSYFLMSDGTAEFVYDDDEHKFHNSARKMCLLSLEDEGQLKLSETIEKYMVGADSSSDDCSFICLTFDEMIPNTETEEIQPITTDEIREPEPPAEEIPLPEETPSVQEKPKKDKTKLPLIITSIILLCLCFVMIILNVIFGFVKNHNENKLYGNETVVTEEIETTTEETTTEIATEETTTESATVETTTEETTTEGTTAETTTESIITI